MRALVPLRIQIAQLIRRIDDDVSIIGIEDGVGASETADVDAVQ